MGQGTGRRAAFERRIELPGGTRLRIRPARTVDRDAVEAYLLGLSDETRHLRFWSASIDAGGLAERAVGALGRDHVTLLAVADDGRVVGGAQYVRMPDGERAEVSVSVTDELQGHGLGSLLLDAIAEAAAAKGIRRLVAEVQPENHRMMNLIREAGSAVTIEALSGALIVEFPTSPAAGRSGAAIDPDQRRARPPA